jgi:uncharacterized membrane protein YhaH (DUF805 family)
MKKYLFAFLFALAIMAVPAMAATPTLPDTGVDVASYVNVLVTALGAIIGVVIGATFSIFVIRRGISWVKGGVR